MKLAFVDTETTGLIKDIHEPWEIAVITRDDDGDHEHCWMLRPTMKFADPMGLRIGRYYERIGDISDVESTELERRIVASELAKLLNERIIVGAVPDFDAEILRHWLANNGQCGTWHYHLCDVETIAAGALRQPPPWNFDSMLKEFGLVYDEKDRHTALGDARMVRDLFDAVFSSSSV